MGQPGTARENKSKMQLASSENCLLRDCNTRQFKQNTHTSTRNKHHHIKKITNTNANVLLNALRGDSHRELAVTSSSCRGMRVNHDKNSNPKALPPCTPPLPPHLQLRQMMQRRVHIRNTIPRGQNSSEEGQLQQGGRQAADAIP